MEIKDIATLPMQQNDADAPTVGAYLQKLLQTLWEEEESFSGKRPFGNSGWKHELYQAVIAGGASDGTLDADGYVESIGDADRVISETIDALFAGDPRL